MELYGDPYTPTPSFPQKKKRKISIYIWLAKLSALVYFNRKATASLDTVSPSNQNRGTVDYRK